MRPSSASLPQRGIANVAKLLEVVAADADIPQVARNVLAMLGEQVGRLDTQLDSINADLVQQHKANPISVALAKIPGVGPITALTLVTEIEPTHFRSGRHVAAWMGLTPKERSTGGRQKLGGISRAGNERLRSLLVVGATAVIQYAKPGRKTASAWLLNLLERRPRKVAAVALANKMARIAWAMMSTGEAYRGAPQAA